MNLSIDEKLKMFCARDGWNIETCNGKVPEVNVADGPAGVRKYVTAPNGEQVVDKSISYPGAAVIANTWNEELCEEVASAIADEAIEQNVDVLLAPAVNIKRSPLCGRNFEYFSEDPILAGRMAAAYVRGVEKKHVCSCVKHFAANNMEKDRLFMSSEVDERTLHEIYLKAFEIAFREKPATIMSAYNKVNGEHASESKNLLTDILRDELGYEGVVMSDWWAVHNPVKALRAGLNLQMPYDKPTYERLKKAYDEGEITEADVDRINRPVLELAEKCESNRKVRKSILSDEERRKISLKAAEEGIVLLKNDGILPVCDGGRITVLGQPNQGVCALGGGSGTVCNKNEIRFFSDCLKDELPKTEVDYIPSFQFVGGDIYFDNFSAGLESAEKSDTLILCVGNNYLVEGEGFDRQTIKLNPKQEEMILQSARCNPNVIVLLFTGSAIDMSAWIDKVRAVVYAGFGGERITDALAAVVSGRVCPSGKLNETFPLKLEDTPAYPFNGNSHVDRYTEGILVGYRHYDTKEMDVLFPFGYGLSYATFEYSDFEVVKNAKYDYTVRFKIKNTSERDGAETAQLYVSDVNCFLYRPAKELKEFKKVFLKAGETRTVEMHLNEECFRAYSPARHAYITESGAFDLLVGASSRDIRLKKRIVIEE